MKQRILSALCAATSTTALAADSQVPYPEGYRDWHHVKSMVIEKGHPLYSAFGGIHHLYANDKAMEGYQKGTFTDGSVIIFDLLEAVQDGNAVTEGDRKVVGVMHKDSKRYRDTGGWGFEGFGSGDRSNRVVGENAASACFACHAPQKAQDYTFSKLRD
jgi:hypothetical protein